MYFNHDCKTLASKKIDNVFQFQTDETKFAEEIDRKIHEKHKNLQKNLNIPFLFIDPVVRIFDDPCDTESSGLDVTSREIEKFQEYTDK